MSQLTRYGFSREAGRQHIPVPLVRRPNMGAMRIHKGWWPGLPAPSSCMADMGNDWPDAPLPQEIPAEGTPQPDSASGLKGSAPEGSSDASVGQAQLAIIANADQSRTRSRAKAGVETAGTEHASQRPAAEPVSRPAAGRTAAATSEPMDATAGETAPVTDPEPLPVDPLPAPAAAPAPAVVRRETTAGNPVRFIPPAERIDLRQVRSRMDTIAEASETQRIAAVQERAAAELGGDLALCRCGSRGMGATAGLVPAWFGRDCIERGCPLKGGAA